MLNRRELFLLFPISILLGGRRAGGAAETPEGIAKGIFELIKQGGGESVRKVIPPEDLREFEFGFRALVRSAVESGGANEVRRFFGVNTLEELDRLKTVEFFDACWQGLLQADPELSEALATAEVRTYGHVIEGGDTVHILYRLALPDGWLIPVLVPRVLTLHRRSGAWLVELRGTCGPLVNTSSDHKFPIQTDSRVEILGVMEEDRTAYVVYRNHTTFDHATVVTGVYVFAIDRADVEWQLALHRDDVALAPIIDRYNRGE